MDGYTQIGPTENKNEIVTRLGKMYRYVFFSSGTRTHIAYTKLFINCVFIYDLGYLYG